MPSFLFYTHMPRTNSRSNLTVNDMLAIYELNLLNLVNLVNRRPNLSANEPMIVSI